MPLDVFVFPLVRYYQAPLNTTHPFLVAIPMSHRVTLLPTTAHRYLLMKLRTQDVRQMLPQARATNANGATGAAPHVIGCGA